MHIHIQSSLGICKGLFPGPPKYQNSQMLKLLGKCVASPFSRELSDPRIESGSPAWQVGSLPSEPPGKPLWLRLADL